MTSDPWHATVLTIFPEMFPGPLGHSLAGRALANGTWRLDAVNIRDFAKDRHRSVDDEPFGGGAGMVMRPDVVDAAIKGVRGRSPQSPENGGQAAKGPGPLIYMTPRGRLLDQPLARELAAGPGCTILCGRFEGVDQRVLEANEAVEVSLGDFVLSGGELPALVMLDAVVRLLPGVVGKEESLTEESFEWGLLEYPHYTRPADWQGRLVPEVLTSGHHEKIRDWRQRQSEEITRQRRPDLWDRHVAARK